MRGATVGELLDALIFLRSLGMSAPAEDGPAGESESEKRLRQLIALQRDYCRDKAELRPDFYADINRARHGRLGELPPEQLGEAAQVIIDDAEQAAYARLREIDRLRKAGHDAAFIAKRFGLPNLEQLQLWIASMENNWSEETIERVAAYLCHRWPSSEARN